MQRPREAEKGRAYKPCETCTSRIKVRIEYLICDDCIKLNKFINSNWKASNGLR